MNLLGRKAFQTGVEAGRQIAKEHAWGPDDFVTYGSDKSVEKRALNKFLKEVSEGFILGFRNEVKLVKKQALLKRTLQEDVKAALSCPSCGLELKELDTTYLDDLLCPNCKRIIPFTELLEKTSA